MIKPLRQVVAFDTIPYFTISCKINGYVIFILPLLIVIFFKVYND